MPKYFNPFTRKNRYRFIFTTIILFVLLEIALRIMGFSYRISSFHSYAHDPDLVTILCIGESSTIGYGVRPGMNYPAQLNRLLNGQKEKKRYYVTYDGDMGANSSQIMLRFSKSMEKYKPQKVIAMIGVNNRFNLDKSNMIRFTGERYFPKLYFRFWRFFTDSEFSSWARFYFIGSLNTRAKQGILICLLVYLLTMLNWSESNYSTIFWR